MQAMPITRSGMGTKRDIASARMNRSESRPSFFPPVRFLNASSRCCCSSSLSRCSQRAVRNARPAAMRSRIRPLRKRELVARRATVSSLRCIVMVIDITCD